jgi:hypothetical protein
LGAIGFEGIGTAAIGSAGFVAAVGAGCGLGAGVAAAAGGGEAGFAGAGAAAAGAVSPGSLIAATAERQAGESDASFFLRHWIASIPPGFTLMHFAI